MCCFRKIWPSVLWHFTQSAGTSTLSRSSALADPCGSWQAPQFCSTTLCLNLLLLACSRMGLWQLPQSSLAGFRRLNLADEACGSWQPAQPFSSTGLWVLLAFFGTTSAWQARQVSLGLASSSLPWVEACGLWQPVQSFDFTGVCTKGFFRTSWKVAWHSRQAWPTAPGLSLNFWAVAADWASAAPGRARTATASRRARFLRMVAPLTSPARRGRRRRTVPRTARAPPP